jgi:hypothetical protein
MTFGKGGDRQVRSGSRTTVAAGLMAQPVYPQRRQFPCGPALTLRARFGSASEKQSKPMNYPIVAICTAGNVEVRLMTER